MENTLFNYNDISASAIKQIREKSNCSQNEFAAMLNVSVATLRNWEQGRRKPDGAAVSLLKLFSHNPQESAKVLKDYSRKPEYSEKEKLEIIKKLNWDYIIDSEKVLSTINGIQSKEKKQLFVKSFQYLHWQSVVRMWGLETCIEMYNDNARKMIIPTLRSKYDFIYGKILGTDISHAGFGASDSSKLFNSILSHRRNRSE